MKMFWVQIVIINKITYYNIIYFNLLDIFFEFISKIMLKLKKSFTLNCLMIKNCIYHCATRQPWNEYALSMHTSLSISLSLTAWDHTGPGRVSSEQFPRALYSVADSSGFSLKLIARADDLIFKLKTKYAARTQTTQRRQV